MNLSTFLALRYFFSKSEDGFIFWITRLSGIGIFIASFSLSIALMVITGFEAETKNNLRGLNSDLILFRKDKKNFNYNLHDRLNALKNQQLISAFCPVKLDQVILQNKDEFTSTTFCSVNSNNYVKCTEIEEKISKIIDRKSITQILTEGFIVIGEKMAKNQHFKVGQKITILSPGTIKKKGVNFKENILTIGGIIKTGFEDYDNNLIIGSEVLYKKLFGKSSWDFLMIKLINEADINKFSFEKFKKKMHVFAYRFAELFFLEIETPENKTITQIKLFLSDEKILHWSEISPNLLAAMKFERFLISLILMLLIILCLTNILAMIFIKIHSKEKEIAILLTLGFSEFNCKKIFIKLGVLLSLTASLLGISCSLLIGFILKSTKFIKLPTDFNLKTLPVNLNLEIPIFVLIAINCLVLFAAFFGSNRINKIKLSQIIRN